MSISPVVDELQFGLQAQLLKGSLKGIPRQVHVMTLLVNHVTFMNLHISNYGQTTINKSGQHLHLLDKNPQGFPPGIGDFIIMCSKNLKKNFVSPVTDRLQSSNFVKQVHFLERTPWPSNTGSKYSFWKGVHLGTLPLVCWIVLITWSHDFERISISPSINGLKPSNMDIRYTT